MISSSPDGYGFLQIERSVLEGGREFLVQVREIGNKILGHEVITAVTDVALVTDPLDEASEPTLKNVTKPLAESKLIVAGEAKDLNVVILHKAVRGDLASRFSFGYNEGKFRAGSTDHHKSVQEDGGRHRARYTERSLSQALDDVSRDFQKDSSNLSVIFDRVDVIGEPGHDLIVAAFPQPFHIGSLVLHRQAKVAFRHLEGQSSKLAFPTNPWLVYMPFGRIPGRTSEHDFVRLLQELNGLMPQRFVLGGVGYSSNAGKATK